MTQTYKCPICGFPELYEAQRKPSTGGSYEIYLPCGFQFGVTDDDLGQSYESWRERWIAACLPWNGVGPPPASWDPVKQLKNLNS